MALETIHASDVPNLDHIPENAALLPTTRFSPGVEEGGGGGCGKGKLMVIGHRGSGMNILQSAEWRMKSIKENSILSFNHAAHLHLHYVEFDVQVTKDNYPVIFHDNHILTKEKETFIEKKVTDITLEEFLSYGPQRESGKVGKPLFRKAKDGSTYEWKVENDDPLCTLEEVFQKVDKSVGFNIEMKFDDYKIYEETELKHVLHVILKVVNEYAKGRPIIFSSFQPDAVQLTRKLQDTFPVFFLTNGGYETTYPDPRRNSLEEAVKLCLEGGLHGIVSQVRAIFRNPAMVPSIKESKLSLLTYGSLNNVAEAVHMQHLMGIEGVIVDFVEEIKEAVLDIIRSSNETEEDSTRYSKGEEEKRKRVAVKFSDDELSFRLKLIPEVPQP